MQTTLNFTSPSPINADKLTGQNKLVYDYLSKGETLNRIKAIELKLTTALNSRISDLTNKTGVVIHRRFININGSKLREYSLSKFE